MNNNILAALIGASVSLVVLLITIFHDRYKARRIEKEQIKKKLLFLSSLVTSIIKYSKFQSEAIVVFLSQIDNNPYKFPLMTFYPKNDIEKISERIEEEGFFNAYLDYYSISGTHVKIFRDIIAKIEYQNLQLNQLIDMIEKSQKDDFDRKKQFGEYFNLATDRVVKGIAENSFREQPGLLALLTRSIEDYRCETQSLSDIQCAHDTFIGPVCKEMVEKNYFEPLIGAEIIAYIHKASSIYMEISMHMTTLNQDIKEIGGKIKSSGEQLQKIASLLLQDFDPDALDDQKNICLLKNLFKKYPKIA
jgi:hypothetical protein